MVWHTAILADPKLPVRGLPLFLWLHISRTWLETVDKENYHLEFSLFKSLQMPHCYFSKNFKKLYSLKWFTLPQ